MEANQIADNLKRHGCCPVENCSSRNRWHVYPMHDLLSWQLAIMPRLVPQLQDGLTEAILPILSEQITAMTDSLAFLVGVLA